MYQNIRHQLFCIAICIYAVYIYNQSFLVNANQLIYTWDNHQQLISKIFHYQIQGNIVYTINAQKQTYMKFLWNQSDNNHYNIKLFNVFGLNIISVSVNNGIMCVVPGIMYQNDNFRNKIQQCFIDTGFFKEQLQQWIIGLPGHDTQYNLNSIGCLSDIHYFYNGENITIFYRLYYTRNTPILPAILEIYYNQYFIKLSINSWSL